MSTSAKREVLQVLKLTKNATLPTRGSPLSAGFDLASALETVIPARGKGLVKTDLSIAIPDGCYARVAPRSGLAYKNFIDTGAGVIDADYRGNVGVVLFNHSAQDFEVKQGDRIAQLIIERISYPELVEVSELSETSRGAGGFGSTGVDGNPSKRLREQENNSAIELKQDELDNLVQGIAKLSKKDVVNEEESDLLKKILFGGDSKKIALIKSIVKMYNETKNEDEVRGWIKVLKEQ